MGKSTKNRPIPGCNPDVSKNGTLGILSMGIPTKSLK